MSDQQAEVLTRLRAAARAVLHLRSAVLLLDDAQALGEVDLCDDALNRLYQRLESPEKADERQHP